MKREHTGDYEITAVAGERVKAFIPSPLPPVPGIDIRPELQQSYDQALIAVGELNSLTSLFAGLLTSVVFLRPQGSRLVVKN